MRKVALITGASQGIGAAISYKLSQENYDLLLCGNRSQSELTALHSECIKNNVSCELYRGDLSDPCASQEIKEIIKNTYNRVDVIINNAGISKIGLITDFTPEDWNQLLATNLSSCFYLTRELLPFMIREKKGKILNISSIWGTYGASCEVAYSTSKGGINSFTRALAKEVAPSGISVNALACGMIDTSMNQGFSPEEIQEICNEIPIGRMASPEEVAQMVSLLLKAPTYLTGQIIGFDGAWI